MLSTRQKLLKRGFDLAVAIPMLLSTSPLLVLAVLVATLDTRQWGVFRQERIGRDARPFRIVKIRTMRSATGPVTTVTTRDDARITRIGSLLRRLKLDELLQLVNVVRGEMSLVGPRPDVAGFADCLTGRDRVVLNLRPGITGPASLAFRDEEVLLASVDDPETYNREVIWPRKVELNRAYAERWRFREDLRCLLRTVLPASSSVGAIA